VRQRLPPASADVTLAKLFLSSFILKVAETDYFIVYIFKNINKISKFKSILYNWHIACIIFILESRLEKYWISSDL